MRAAEPVCTRVPLEFSRALGMGPHGGRIPGEWCVRAKGVRNLGKTPLQGWNKGVALFGKSRILPFEL